MATYRNKGLGNPTTSKTRMKALLSLYWDLRRSHSIGLTTEGKISITIIARYSLTSLASFRHVANHRLIAASSTKRRASNKEQLIHSTTPRHLSKSIVLLLVKSLLFRLLLNFQELGNKFLLVKHILLPLPFFPFMCVKMFVPKYVCINPSVSSTRISLLEIPGQKRRDPVPRDSEQNGMVSHKKCDNLKVKKNV